MRDLVIFRPDLGQGGADRVTLTLLRHLDRDLFKPSLVLVRRRGEFLADVPSDVQVTTLDAESLWTAWLPMARYLRSHPPDILFCTCGGASIPAVIAHLLAGRPGRLVVSERNVLFHGGATPKRILLFMLKAAFYRLADSVFAVSAGVKRDLVQLLRLPLPRVTVVYNPVVGEELAALAAEPVEHPWFSDRVPVILAAGRFVREKDYPTLVEAFARVVGTRPARLVILGDGPLRARIARMVEARGLAADVWLPGFDKNPFRYMARAAVFVLSSTAEGLPGVLIQAMGCGAAVVSTRCHAGPDEIVTDGIDGFLVPVGDAGALAGRIAYLLDHPAARAGMGERARATARRFAVDAMVGAHAAALLDGTG